MKCAFCFFSKPFNSTVAEFIINGISVCEDHVDNASGDGFGRDLARKNLDDQEN